MVLWFGLAVTATEPNAGNGDESAGKTVPDASGLRLPPNPGTIPVPIRRPGAEGRVSTRATAFGKAGPACHGHEQVFDRSGRPDLAPRALEICHGCPILDSCRSWALTTDLGWKVAGGMTAPQRRQARRRAGLPEPAPRDEAWIFTQRQQIADADDPGLRRRLISDAWSSLLAAGFTHDEAAGRLGVGVGECRRARDAVRASDRRRALRQQREAAPPSAPDADDQSIAGARPARPEGSSERRDRAAPEART
jgi:hypothetical protein